MDARKLPLRTNAASAISVIFIILLGIAEAKCILATAVCVSVCLSARRRIPTLLHGSGCNLGMVWGAL